MESSVMPFCENWSVVSAIYTFQAINQYHPLNPDTTSRYKLKLWLEEASQCQFPSLNLCEFDPSEFSRMSLQGCLNEFLLSFRNHGICNQNNNSIKYLSISNKKLMDDSEIKNKDVAFFANLQDKNIQPNFTINKANWRLVGIFSGKPKICFCYIQNQWRNLCSSDSINWNWPGLVLCYVKCHAKNTETINLDKLQRIECLAFQKSSNQENSCSENVKDSKISNNKNLLREEHKNENLTSEKNVSKRIKKKRNKKGATNKLTSAIVSTKTFCALSKPNPEIYVVSTTKFSVLNKPNIDIYFAPEEISNNNWLDIKEVSIKQDNILAHKFREFCDFSCQFSQDCISSSHKSSDISIFVELQKKIDSLRKSNNDKQTKIEGLELDLKTMARNIENKNIPQKNLQDSLNENDNLRKLISQKEKEIQESKQDLNLEIEKRKAMEAKISVCQKENEELKKLIIEKDNIIKKMHNNLQSLSLQLEKCFNMIIDFEERSNLSMKTLENKITDLKEKAIKEKSTTNPSPIFLNRKLGLPNIGNSCYMNSLLQILASTNCFVEKVQNALNLPIFEKLYSVLEKIRNKKATKNVLKSSLEELILEIGNQFPHIRSLEQQDSKEIFQIIASLLDDAFPNNNTFTISIKQNQYCYSCELETYLNDEHQSFLVIPSQAEGDLKTIVKEKVTMEKIYAKKNSLICGKCKVKRKIKIKMVEHKWPEVLVLYFPKESSWAKLVEILDVEDCRFSLYGIIQYFGSGKFGHYRAMTKDGKSWNMYDDSNVSQCHFSDENKYLAFYKRIDTRQFAKK